MVPYVTEMVPPAVRLLFERVTALLESINELRCEDGTLISCHALAEAFAAHVLPREGFSLVAAHGYFASSGWEHGWLRVETDDPFERWIIDVYPWAALVGSRGGAILVCMNGLSPWRTLYMEEEKVIERIRQKESWSVQLGAIERILLQAQQRLA